MPLLAVQHVKKLTATVHIEEPLAATVDKYAAFIHASADDVLNKALEYVFARDKDFQKFLSSDAAASVTPSLQLKRSRVARKVPKASKSPTPMAMQR
jgi:hypothetical protein